MMDDPKILSTTAGRVVTLTSNPTLDAISEIAKGKLLETLETFDVVRVQPFRYQIGGKGVTSGRMLKVLGGNCLAVVLLGKDGVSRCIEHYLRLEKLRTKIVRTQAPGRICLILTEVDGDETKPIEERETTGVDYRINGGGSPVDQTILDSMFDSLRLSLHGAKALALAGSLPYGAPKDLYGQCIRLARELVPLVMLDSSGDPLLFGAEARPTLIKINAHEAAGLMQAPLPTTIPAAAALAWKIIGRFNQDAEDARKLEKVIITMGSRGAAAVDLTTGTQWAIQPPSVKARGALGAGDSFSAGLAYALTAGKDFTEALRWGAACGAATARKRAGEIGDLASVIELYQQVAVVPLEV